MRKAFPVALALMCIGALMMISLSLSAPRISVPSLHKADLARFARDATMIVASATLALFVGSVIAFIIIERQQSGGQRIIRMPKKVPGWVRMLSLALVLLAIVAATYDPPTEPSENKPEPKSNGQKQKAPSQSMEASESEYEPTPEPPVVSPPKVIPWPWWKYALLFMVLLFIAVMGISLVGPRRSPVIPKPVVADSRRIAEMLSIDMVELSDNAISMIEEETDHRKAVLMCYLAFLSALQMKDCPVEACDTPEECAYNVEQKLRMTRRSLDGLIAAYQKAYFSTHDVTARDKAKALSSLRSLKSCIDELATAEVVRG